MLETRSNDDVVVKMHEAVTTHFNIKAPLIACTSCLEQSQTIIENHRLLSSLTLHNNLVIIRGWDALPYACVLGVVLGIIACLAKSLETDAQCTRHSAHQVCLIIESNQ
jgi:hypothetical protein